MFRALACALVCVSVFAPLSSTARGQEALPKPSEAEASIREALSQDTKLDFADQPLIDVLEQFKKQHEIPIQLDNKALGDEGMGDDTPVTAALEGISLRSALRLVLGQLDLTYVIRDEVLLVTTRTDAENMLDFKVYPVRDLVSGKSELLPASCGKAQEEDYQSLIELITTNVSPTTWDEVGGPGSIMAFRHSHALAFSQTTEVHEEIAELLAALRRVRDKQIEAARAFPQEAAKSQPAEREGAYIKVYRLESRTAIWPDEAQSMMFGGGFFALPDDTAGADGLSTRQTTSSPASSASSVEAGGRGASGQAPASSSTTNLERLDQQAQEIAALLPEIVSPESWAPKGVGLVRPVAGSLVIRQTDAAHRQIDRLLASLLPGYSASMRMVNERAARLTVPGPQLDWPREAEPRPNVKAAAVEKALDSKLDLSFVDAPLSNVVDFIEQQAKITVVFDAKALADAGMGTDMPVTRELKGLSLRSALRLMLGEMDLTYVVRDEVLMITTKTEAENMLVCKVYPVFDLAIRPAGAPPRGVALDFESLVINLTSNIAPAAWDDVGGPGGIQSFASAGALVITQTTEVHEEIARYLQALREASAEQN